MLYRRAQHLKKKFFSVTAMLKVVVDDDADDVSLPDS